MQTKNKLKIRRANAWKAVWAQSKILRGKMNLKSKIKILDNTVYPTLTYGAQTWACTATQIQKVPTTQHATLRIITGTRLRDRIHISKLYNITKTKNLANFSGKLKLKYAGHVARGPKHIWNNLATFWVPSNGRRKKGRPAMRW